MKLIFSLVVISLICIGCGRSTSTSLPINGGFEAGSSEWILGKAVVTESSPRSGKKCLMITNDSAHWSYGDQFIHIPNGTKEITISGWIKTRDIVRGQESWETALLNFEFVDSLLTHIDPYPEAAAEIVGTTEWSFYSKTTAAIEAYAMKFHIALGNATGTAWFDDLKAVFTDADGVVLESTHISPKRVAEIRGE